MSAMGEPTVEGVPIEEEEVETQEWLDSLKYVLHNAGPERVRRLLEQLQTYSRESGVSIPFSANTPYINTIPAAHQPPYPGSHELERRIRNILRWNAMVMVVRANRDDATIGGHIATYASAATLYEVGFNHFFRGRGSGREPDAAGDGRGLDHRRGLDHGHDADLIYFQAHCAPGIYARAFLEGRLQEEQLENFRHELSPGGGLSSYPHPYLMPDFWEFPTASMGLSPVLAIYQARFNRYLEDRGLKPPGDSRVWAFLGDGETDEPEALGAITLAARERLDNLIFVINCNLQRLDGPVRGNGKIIQELEAAFRGAGWNVIKVIWGSEWDPLLAQDHEGLLVQRMGDILDGQYQKYSVSAGAEQREHFFGGHSKLVEMSRQLTDEQIRTIRRGGHDPDKVYAAYKAAVEHEGAPTVILAKTIKGYGMGPIGEGRNTAHQQKRLNEEALREARTRFGIPLSDAEVADAPFYRPPQDSPEMEYLRERRLALGGFLPSRRSSCGTLPIPSDNLVLEFADGSGDRTLSTTGAFVHLLSRVMRDKELGKRIVPIVPDEARTFGMEALFRQYGIYSHVGQLYEPVDRDTLLYYKEARDGQLLEEGITEAGGLSSFIAAGTAYSTHGINTLPFFVFYSIFGLQRVGDLIWAAADLCTRGFLIGATSGRTTLNGEGLQHQDGHSHALAHAVPSLVTYDPAFSWELAIIIRDGIRRMCKEQESVFYYLTVQNEQYPMPRMPSGVGDGILRGMYRFAKSPRRSTVRKAHLFAGGAILNEALAAAAILEERYDVAADVWSVTSFRELYRDGMETERWNGLHPAAEPRLSYVGRCLEGSGGAFVMASDYLKLLPVSISRWFPRQPVCLGTDGFGRSDSRTALRDFFEVDGRHIAFAALSDLYRQEVVDRKTIARALDELEIDPERPLRELL